jgi:CIC family chloride channel protein
VGYILPAVTPTPRESSQRRLIVETLLLGVAGALAAQVFNLLLRAASWLFLGQVAGYQPPGLPNEGGVAQAVVGPHGLWLVPVATTLGGLIVGWLVTRWAPEVEGHGADTAIRAFHRSGGVLRARVAPIKAFASAITIGSGGSAGREGPVALISSGIASIYSSFTRRSERDRRLLMLIGMAAGLSAIFRSPIGTALFAIEVLYSDVEFESDALLYTILSAIIAYAVNGLFVGWEPLFRVPASLALPRLLDHGWYVVLGGASGLIAFCVPWFFYTVRDQFRRLPLAAWLRPALGGLLLGVLALALPQVLSGGYGGIQAAIDGQVGTATLLFLVFGEIVAMSLTVSAGGSGGVFAPGMFIGAMLGGFLAAVTRLPPAPFVVVGMAAVFGGAARVPMAALMMVSEMTGGYDLLVPAALAVMLSYLIQVRLSRGVRYRSLYEAQVPRRTDSPAHHTEHLEIALRILEERRLSGPLRGRLDLLTLLRSGTPVELPDDRHLTVGVLKANSPLVKKTVAGDGGAFDAETRVIGIIRGEHMIGVRPDTALDAGDRLILVTTREGLERLKPHVDGW